MFTSPLRSTVAPAIVLVSHYCPIVAAGLLETLRPLPEWEVEAWDERPHRGAANAYATDVKLIIGDLAFVSRLLDDRQQHQFGSSRFIVVSTHCADESEAALTVPPGIEKCLVLPCRDGELVDAVRQFRSGESRIDVGALVTGGLPPGVLYRVRTHIAACLQEGIDLDDLAAMTGLSVSHFSRAFKRSVGMPPHRYLLQLRVTAAVELICNTDDPLAEIALTVGFSDQSHFTRVFSKQQGESPGRYRRRYR